MTKIQSPLFYTRKYESRKKQVFLRQRVMIRFLVCIPCVNIVQENSKQFFSLTHPSISTFACITKNLSLLKIYYLSSIMHDCTSLYYYGNHFFFRCCFQNMPVLIKNWHRFILITYHMYVKHIFFLGKQNFRRKTCFSQVFVNSNLHWRTILSVHTCRSL